MADVSRMRYPPTPEQIARLEKALGTCEFFEHWADGVALVTIGVWCRTLDGRPREARMMVAPEEVPSAWNAITYGAEKNPQK